MFAANCGIILSGHCNTNIFTTLQLTNHRIITFPHLQCAVLHISQYLNLICLVLLISITMFVYVFCFLCYYITLCIPWQMRFIMVVLFISYLFFHIQEQSYRKYLFAPYASKVTNIHLM